MLHYKRLWHTGSVDITRIVMPAKGRVCCVEGCERHVLSRGFCQMHYARVVKTGDPGEAAPRFLRVRKREACTVDGCNKENRAHGLCAAHFSALRRRDRARPTCSVEGCVAPVEGRRLCRLHYDEDRRRRLGRPPKKIWPLGSRRLTRGGYVEVRCAKGDAFADGELWPLEHRYVMARQIGRPLLRAEQVHHRNGVKTDNRPENLEIWNTSHPAGQRPEDLLVWARHIIALYAPN